MSDVIILDYLKKPRDEQFKNFIIGECRRMDRLDVYEWVADDELKIEKLQQENKQLKERVIYLENSNNRREETIISLRNEQQLDLYKEVINEIEKFITENKKKVYHNPFIDDDCGIEIHLDRLEIEELEKIIIKVKEGDYNG